MKSGIKSSTAKQIIFILLIITFWQFTFPQLVGAQELKSNDYSEIKKRFEDQWQISMLDKINRLPVNDSRPQPVAKETMVIPVSAYSSTPDQTSGNPFVTASGSHVRDGVIAANFLPIGTRVRFPEHYGDKIFIVEDRMHQRYWHKADIWMKTREEAKNWGVKYTTIEIL